MPDDYLQGVEKEAAKILESAKDKEHLRLRALQVAGAYLIESKQDIFEMLQSNETDELDWKIQEDSILIKAWEHYHSALVSQVEEIGKELVKQHEIELARLEKELKELRESTLPKIRTKREPGTCSECNEPMHYKTTQLREEIENERTVKSPFNVFTCSNGHEALQRTSFYD
jgi:hypothetical protein